MARGTGSPRRKRIPLEIYDTVRVMLAGMLPLAEIEKQVGNRFDKSRPYVRDVIRTIHQDWADGAVMVQETRRHQIREGWQQLYRQANADKDWHACAKILTELGRLDGCYSPSQVQVQHQGAIGVGISLGSLGFKTPQEVAARVDWLKAQIAARGPSAIQAAQPQLVAQAQLSDTAPDNHDPSTYPSNVIDVDPTGGAS
jgi:hypothetical protein